MRAVSFEAPPMLRPNDYRKEAARIRIEAASMPLSERAIMQNIAALYEKLADHAEIMLTLAGDQRRSN